MLAKEKLLNNRRSPEESRKPETPEGTRTSRKLLTI